MSEENTSLELDSQGRPVDSVAQPEVQEQKYVTADDMKKFQDSMFANMRRMLEGVNKPKAESKPVTKEASPISDELALRDSFDDAIAGRNLNRDTLKRLRKSFMLERPEDAGAWVDDFLGAFGSGQPEPQQSKEPEMKKPIVSDAGQPIGTPIHERPSNPFGWSHDDVERIWAQKGKKEGNRFIRQKAEEYLRGKRITGLKPTR